MRLGKLSRFFALVAICALSFAAAGCRAHGSGPIGREPSLSAGPVKNQSFQGREYNLYTPSSVAGRQNAPLLVVLHGGYGNAGHIEKNLGMNPVADKYGFKVAYLNGTPARLAPRMRFWNTGAGCCGPAERQNIDDVGFIGSFIDYMVRTQGADRNNIYLMGHSNGSMMAYSYVCQTGGVSAMVGVSGPLLMESCPRGRGVRVLHIHGSADENVPVEGGSGTKTMTKKEVYRSVAHTKQALENAGASFRLRILEGVPHDMDSIRKAIDLPEEAAKFLLNR